MGTDANLIDVWEECNMLIKLAALQDGIKPTSDDFNLVVRRIMGSDLSFMKAIEKNPPAALASYELTQAEIDFVREFVFSRTDFEKQVA